MRPCPTFKIPFIEQIHNFDQVLCFKKHLIMKGTRIMTVPRIANAKLDSVTVKPTWASGAYTPYTLKAISSISFSNKYIKIFKLVRSTKAAIKSCSPPDIRNKSEEKCLTGGENLETKIIVEPFTMKRLRCHL